MREELANKWDRLKGILIPLGKVAVSFSGGVDSTLLLLAVREALGPEQVLAVTARSHTLPDRELARARATAAELGVPHLELEIDELADPEFRQNPPDRCYHCKKTRLREMAKEAAARGFFTIVEGTNRDDLSDYRPGLKATEEAGARSPLLEAGLSKADIRELSRAFGLAGWDRPAAACLASRIPYGEEITPARLQMVEEAEDYLADLGFAPVRVRHHGDLARLEVAPADRGRLLEQADTVHERLTGLGFKFVALDLAGYRTGSLNRTLAHPAREQGES
ncbi:MAG: ATP-dependent sacrificial sulfur transferase LarE [Chitinophagales bacterium]